MTGGAAAMQRNATAAIVNVAAVTKQQLRLTFTVAESDADAAWDVALVLL